MRMKNVGFIGTGIMGEPMAHHLLKAGYTLQVWNRSAHKLDALIMAGARHCASAAEAARGADVVICMLSSGPVCDEVLLGVDGVIEQMTPGATLIVMSSIPVESARRQAEAAMAKAVRYLDAPVSGGQQGARDGTLVIMVGGPTADYDAARPLLECMGRSTRVGAAGAGQLAKLTNQLIVAGTIGLIAEAFTLAERGGADPRALREALLGGFADSTILRQHGQRMIEGDFAPGGPAKYQLKDTTTALALATTLGLELPLLRQTDALFKAMVDHGDGELDHSGLIREIRRHNHLAPAGE
ncbi:NAD(P)-dependent oxidoreductase [Phytohalomonas tamaricis]|uniref:NAD(P)-dependent oxidoreductase n=1 Tax=Phytohalomonas tamaricis TaxID=2081032 RepID=UPI000D0B702D|nr:NAD(P)-dependent oxidoreductase [Phytohalomonas tamaricis]